jgi:Ca2+-transporting ATPase
MDDPGSSEKWYTCNVETVFQRLNSGRSGLTSEEAKNRLSEYDYNELPEKKRISPVGIFISQFRNYLILVLIGAAIISGFTGETTNAYVILFIILFISVLGFIQEYRAERAMEALKKMVAYEARVLRDGKVKKIATRELVPGDIIHIEAGDRIPADARIVEAIYLEITESSLTGESHPVSKSTDALSKDTPAAEQKNMLFMGTTAVRGNGIAVIVGTGKNTHIGSIAPQDKIRKPRHPACKDSPVCLSDHFYRRDAARAGYSWNAGDCCCPCSSRDTRGSAFHCHSHTCRGYTEDGKPQCNHQKASCGRDARVRDCDMF